jgi:lipopolysaccharide biosynthesis protein
MVEGLGFDQWTQSHDLNFHGWEETNLKNWDEILLMNSVENI